MAKKRRKEEPIREIADVSSVGPDLAEIPPAETGIGDPDPKRPSGIAVQAWFSLAFWLSFGLLLEGLIGFRSPAYLQDATRRELFRLAHAHGALLSILLLVVWLYLQGKHISPPNAALRSLQAGAILMPVGFLLGGAWHYESDPNALVFLAPLGGVMIIFGVIAIAISARSK